MWVLATDGLTLPMGLAGSFFFFFGFMSVGSVIRGGHGWWSPAWVASLASLLAWG